MKKAAIFTYGVVVYGAFLGIFLYLIGFVGDFAVPKGINDGAVGPVGIAVAINVALISVFGVQHTIMARPAFKAWWTRIIPQSAERSTFVLTTVGILALIFWQWQPIEGTVWSIEAPAARAVIWSLFALGWAIVLYSTFLINHFDLFGLRQVTLQAMGKQYTPVEMKVTSLYRVVRNPLMTGFMIALWAIPDMTYSSLVFAATYTTYIMIGVTLEERSIAHELGDEYKAYQARTPKFFPNPTKPMWSGARDVQTVEAQGK